MSLAHARGLRDAMHKLRDTYYPPTAEEVQLFSSALTTEAAPEPEAIRLQPEMPVPMPDFKPAARGSVAARTTAHRPPTATQLYTKEEVETRW